MSILGDLKLKSPEEIEAHMQKSAYDRERRIQQARQRLKQEAAAAQPLPKLVFDGEEDCRPVNWRIANIIPAEGAGMLFGETDVGKTFSAVSMGVAISAGISWQGHGVSACTTLFIEAEGGSSFGIRKHAAKAEAGITPNLFKPFPFVTLYEPLGFGPDTDPSLPLLRAAYFREEVMRRGFPPIGFVVADTLAQNIQGDADSNHDTSAFLRLFRAFLKALSDDPVFGLLIHHPGHTNKERARGAYSLPADLDLIMQLEGTPNELTLSCDRMRDGERFNSIPLALAKRLVMLDNGQSTTTLVTISRDGAVEGPADRKKTDLRNKILNHVERHPQETTTQIGKALGGRYSNIVTEVDKLVEARLIEIIPVKHGRATRQTYVTATRGEGVNVPIVEA